MPITPFTTECRGDALVVTANAPLGSLISTGVRSEADHLIGQLLQCGLKKLVFDMRNSGYFGSQMIELMLVVWRRLSPLGGALALCNLSPEGREVLRVVGLDAYWPICDSLDQALATTSEC